MTPNPPKAGLACLPKMCHNSLLVADTQPQVAVSRRVLRAVQRQR
jgi:hypothetical protein